MKIKSNRSSVEALKNMLSEIDLIISTTVPLPENRTERCRNCSPVPSPLLMT